MSQQNIKISSLCKEQAQVLATQSNKSQKLIQSKSPKTIYENILSNFGKQTNEIKTTQNETIKSLKQRIYNLENKVQQLIEENTQLKMMQYNSFDKIKQRFNQMRNYQQLLEQVQELKIENVTLKKQFIQLKNDFQISFQPIKQLCNQILKAPINQINECLQISLIQKDQTIKLLLCQTELLNIERQKLLDSNSKLENIIEKSSNFN